MLKVVTNQYILKASTLFYALVISLLIAIISTAIISIAYYQKLLFDFDLIQEKLIRNTQSGLNLMLSDKESFIAPYTIDLFGESNDSVIVSKRNWGLFEIIQAESFQQTIKGKQSKRKTALVGTKPDSITLSALHIVDNKKALSISGTTKIIGNAYLSKAGINSALINKEGYLGDKLVYGEQKQSKTIFPRINQSLITNITHRRQKTAKTATFNLPDSVETSFFEPTLFIRKKAIYIDNQLLKGNICIVADSLIYIGKNTVIEDVLLYAPIILIEAGFVGSFQAFAEKKIVVGDHTTIHFPSVLALLKKDHSFSSPQMFIGKHVNFTGLIFVWTNNIINYLPQLYIDTNTIIKGQVFANANITLESTIIYGNITLQKFILKTKGKLYDNHLYNTILDASKRTQYYISPFFLEKKGKNAIVKWFD